MGEEAFLGRLR